jgi:hypothetical protein
MSQVQTEKETSSKLVMPSDISPIPDIRKTAAHMNVVLPPCSPYENKLSEDFEKNAAKYKKKAGNNAMEGGLKKNYTPKGKRKN